MQLRSGFFASRRFAGLALASAALLLGAAVLPGSYAGAASSPFDGLHGSWSGSGTLKLADGGSERLRCRVTYEVGGGGQRLKQDLRCAGDSWKFDVESEISDNADAGRVSGTWTETNYGTGGFLSGSVSGGAIKARVEGGSFSASVDVATSGAQQSVTIRPNGTEVAEVSVTLRKSG